jgi:hypothetical protein
MRGWVYDERMPAKMRRCVFEHMVLVGGILLNDGHGADAVCRVDAMKNGIVPRAIDTRADGQDSDNRARVGVQDDQLTIARGGEEGMTTACFCGSITTSSFVSSRF